MFCILTPRTATTLHVLNPSMNGSLIHSLTLPLIRRVRDGCLCLSCLCESLCETVCTENATLPTSTESRNFDSSASRDKNSNWKFGPILICTEEFHFCDLVDFVDFGVWNFQWNLAHVIQCCTPCSDKKSPRRLFVYCVCVRYAQECVMLHLCMSCVTHINVLESRLVCFSHVCVCLCWLRQLNESYFTYEWVLSHIWFLCLMHYGHTYIFIYLYTCIFAYKYTCIYI